MKTTLFIASGSVTVSIITAVGIAAAMVGLAIPPFGTILTVIGVAFAFKKLGRFLSSIMRSRKK